jgi:O-antigen ligase
LISAKLDRTDRTREADLSRSRAIFTATAFWLAAIGTAAIPLFVSLGGKDPFRLPKILLLRADGLLIGAVLLIGTAVGAISLRRIIAEDRRLWIGVAAVSWAFIVTLASPMPQVSVHSFLTVSACMMFFLAAYLYADRAPLSVLWLIIVPAMANGIFFITQQRWSWNPFLPVTEDRLYMIFRTRTAFLGNSNDVADLLTVGLVCAVALAALQGRRMRILSLLATVILLFSLLATGALTVLPVVAGAVIALAVVSMRRNVMIWIMLALFLAVAIVVGINRVEARTGVALSTAAIDEVLSGRLVAYAAAGGMGLDHVVTGVGPGRFGAEYFEYQIRMKDRFDGSFYEPSLWINYSEVHNDYLQIFAESGLPGLLILLTALIVLARSALSLKSRGEPDVPRVEFARTGGLMITVSLAIMAAAHFPLQLAATLVVYSFAGGLIIGWTRLAR